MQQVWDREGLETFEGFARSEDAIRWGLEVMRRRRLPKLTTLWREALPMGCARTALGLPEDRLGRLGLALKIVEVLAKLPEQPREILELWVLGDDKWQALQPGHGKIINLKTRRYSYTYAQLGEVLGCSARTAWRWVHDALAMMEPELVRLGVMHAPALASGTAARRTASNTPHDNFKKVVRINDFVKKHVDM